MKKYHRLTLEKRYQIQALKASGLSLRQMSLILSVHPSTICRELKRNSLTYSARKAQRRAVRRRKYIRPKRKIRGDLKTKIDFLLMHQWSPDQISVCLKRRGSLISHETIYRYVYREHLYSSERKLYLNLRRQKRWRRSRQKLKNQKNCASRPRQVSIHERPQVANQRLRIGDFERDLMLGKNSRLLTIVDRKSKLTKIAKLENHAALDAHEQTLRLLEGLRVHTITNDNGSEFSLHELTAQNLKAQVFFADPYCSWQRGTNENTNGLIRQYYPKGTDFNLVPDEEIKRVEDLLNNRPRKTLGYLTPNEVHAMQSQSVALGC